MDTADTVSTDSNENTDEQSVSRRGMMLAGGAAAIGVVAAASAARPAAAGAPMPVNKNTSNVVNAPTELTGDVRDTVLGGGDVSGIFTSALSASNLNPTVGTAFYGVAQSFGVAGLASNNTGTGVFGRSEAGSIGVHGWTYGDPATSPATQFTSGVFAQISSSYAGAPAVLTDGTITLRSLQNPGGVPDSDDAEAGDLTIRRQADGTATWWVCVRAADGGEPAQFVRLASPDAAGAFEPLDAPRRSYDSRPGEGPATGPKTPLAVEDERTIDCTLNTGGDVPSDARTLTVNLTATRSTGPGFLAARAADAPWTDTSSVNYATAQNVANEITVRCDQGRIIVRAGGVGVVDFIVDVIGFTR